MSTPLIFIVDDDPSVGRGVARLLASVGYRSETFASAAEFLLREPYDGPSCLVLDLQMPEMNGLELQKRLAERHHVPPIVFISGHGDIPSSVRAMKSGAIDFLPKPFTAEEFLSAVSIALERGNKSATEQAERDEILVRWSRLTQRERQVFSLIVGGALNKQVAFQLGTSEKTIKAHRAHVMQKMGTRSFAELVRMAEKIETEAGPLPLPAFVSTIEAR